MREKLILLLVAVITLLPFQALGRDYSVVFDGSNVETTLKTLKKVTGYDFVYQKDLIKDKALKISGNFKDQPIESILDDVVVAQMGLAYKVMDKTIVLQEKAPSAGKVVNGTIKGVVVDEEDEPLPGATVMVKGTATGVSTNIDGEFEIKVDGKNPVLSVSYVGMHATEYRLTAANTQTPVRIVLKSNAALMEEVVVTGYQTISKERATGSFDIIDKKQLEKATGNIASRIVGASAGLTATQDAYGNPTFEVRGTSSFNVNSAPLLVVDGFAIEGGFESINPNDVESITVLKDAAAASIWGAKSANGVIVITTKSGAYSNDKKSVVNVNYSGFYKVSPKMDLDYALSRTSSDNLIDYERSTYGKWSSSVFWPEETEPYNGGSSVYYLLNEHRLGHITEAEMNAGIEKYRGIDNRDQIKKYVLQNPMTLQQNVGINVATERSTTAISLLYQNQHSHWKGDADNKYMVSLNNRTSLYKWLDLIVNGNFDYTNSKLDGMHSLPGLASFENLVDSEGNLIRYNSVSPYYLEKYVPTDKFPYQDWTWNPLDDVYNSKNKQTRLNARIQLGLNFNIWRGLKFESRLQYEMIDQNTNNYYNEDSNTVREFVNQTSTWNRTTNTVTQNVPSGGFLDRTRVKYGVLTIRNQVNFNHTFLDKHNIAVVGGVETTNRHYKTFGFPRTYGYNDETLSVAPLPNGGSIYDWEGNTVNLLSASYGGVSTFTDNSDRYFSAFGNLSYTFDGKYTVSGSYRTDASNLITDDPAYRYAPFWSVGAGWQLGKEKFMSSLTWLDRLNIRATYGYNGNVDKSTSFKPLLTVSSTPNIITGQFTGSIASYGNPTLRWEKTGTWDFGVDYDMFGGKLFGKIDVYRKMSEDLIANREISAVQGTTSMKLNNGKILNKGFELEIGSALNITNKIAWTGTLRLSYNHNEVKALKVSQHYGYNLVEGGSGAWVEGEDMHTLWCYEYGGLINLGSETSPHMAPSVYYEDGERVGFTSYLYGDGTSYCLNMGTTVAPWNMSFSSNFRIYDFDFGFILTGKFGHSFKRESFNYPAGTGSRYNLNSKYDEIKNCDPEVYCPLPQVDDETRFYFWDRFYPYLSYLAENAGHIRMQEISLSYNFQKRLLSKLGMKSASVTFLTNNPFNIYFNSYNEDPEFAKGGMRLQPSYTIGLKVGF